MGVAAIQRLFDDYRHTWDSIGLAGRRFLIGGIFYAIRIIAFSVAFPLFAKGKGFDSSQIGLFLAIGSFSLFLFGIPVTRYGARGYTRQILVLAPLVSVAGIVMILLAPAGNFPLVFLGALLSGSVSTAFWILGDPLLAAIVPAGQRTHVYALKFALITFGFALGGGLGGWIPGSLESAGMNSETALAITMGFIALLDFVQFFVFRSMPKTDTRVSGATATVVEPSLKRRPGRHIWIFFLLLVMPEIGMAIGHNAIRPFLSLFFDEQFDLSPAVTGTTIAIMMLVGGIGALLLPRMAGKFGNVTTMAVIRFAGAVALMVVVAALNLAVVMAALLVYFAIVDGTEAIYVAEAMDRLAALDRSNFSGFYAMGWSAASAFAAASSGILQDRSADGFTAAFGLGIAGYLFSAAWLLIVFPRLPNLTNRDQVAQSLAQ